MGRKSKGKYYYHQEPICICMKCGKEHLRRERKKIVPEQGSKFLSILVCPFCGAENYTFAGDKEVRRKVKK